MCGLFLCEIIKGFQHYARILIFLSCFGIYSDFSYFFSQLFRLLGWIWELFWEFLQFQLLFLAIFLAFGLDLGAVLGISAVSATFSRNYSGFWAGFRSCFGNFCSFSYFSHNFSSFWAEVWGAVLKDLGITAPQGLPTILSINETLIPESVPTEKRYLVLDYENPRLKEKGITPQFYTWSSGYASVLTDFTYAGGDHSVTFPSD